MPAPGAVYSTKDFDVEVLVDATATKLEERRAFVIVHRGYNVVAAKGNMLAPVVRLAEQLQLDLNSLIAGDEEAPDLSDLSTSIR